MLVGDTAVDVAGRRTDQHVAAGRCQGQCVAGTRRVRYQHVERAVGGDARVTGAGGHIRDAQQVAVGSGGVANDDVAHGAVDGAQFGHRHIQVGDASAGRHDQRAARKFGGDWAGIVQRGCRHHTHLRTRAQAGDAAA